MRLLSYGAVIDRVGRQPAFFSWAPVRDVSQRRGKDFDPYKSMSYGDK